MGFIFISLSVFSFGLSNCLWVYPLRQLSFLQVIVLRSFLTTVFFGCLLVLSSLTHFGIEPNGSVQIAEIGKAVAISAFSFFGLYFYVQSLKFEKVSLAVPISSISGLFGVLTGIVFLKESVTVKFLIACLIVLVGVNIVNGKTTFKLSKGVRYNLLAAFFWGLVLRYSLSP